MKPLADERVYIDLDKASAPEWAKGCDRCKYGVIGADYTSSPLPLYQAQPLLAEAGLIRFCNCDAGRIARSHAANEWRAIKDNSYIDFMRRQIEQWIEATHKPTFNGEQVQP